MKTRLLSALGALLAVASFTTPQAASAAAIAEITSTPVAGPTLVVTAQISSSPMVATTVRDDGYPTTDITAVPLGTVYASVEIHMSDHSAFKLFSGTFVVHRTGLSDVSVDYTGATYSSSGSPQYRIYDSGNSDVTVFGQALTAPTENTFVLNSLVGSGASLDNPGDQFSVEFSNTVTQGVTNYSGTGTATETYVPAVPEPSVFVTMVCGIAMLAGVQRFRSRSVFFA